MATYDHNHIESIGTDEDLELEANGLGGINMLSPVYTVVQNITDDSVLVIDVGANKTGFVWIASQGVSNGIRGCYWFRTISAPAPVAGFEIATVTTIDKVANTVLTGTTGTDTRITLSSTNAGNFYIENRSGAAVLVTVFVMAA